MTQRNNSAHHRLHYLWQKGLTKKRFASTLPAQSLCWLSSVSLLSGGFVFAQTETQIDNIVPTVETSQPTAVTNPGKKQAVVPEATPAPPEFSQRRARLSQRLRKKPEVAQSKEPVRQSTPKIEAAQAVILIRQKLKVEASQVTPPRVRQENPNTPARSLPEKLPEVTQPANNSNSTVSATTGKTKDYNNAYIDPNSYDSGATGTYQAPNSVILTERSSGCKATLPSGQSVLGGVCAKTPQSNVANNTRSTPTWLRRSQNAQLPIVPPVRQVATTGNTNRWGAVQSGSSGDNKTAYRPNRFIPNPSEFSPTTVSATPIAPSGGALPPPMADGNIAPRPSNVAYDFSLASVLPQIPYSGVVAYSGTGMMYPLSVPAPITSLFGWRIHPITGDRRFHAGTDLGAPMGTPVLAAAAGQVETANWMGGYGLTVILNHKSAEQTLYGHMSEILVHPGQWVQPGTVIGLVGSTGNSTGAHLHFEVRHLTANGWVATDPGVQLQFALNQLVRSLQTAQVSQEPGS
ncbi:peptidoglycan DD-metalloendopeptidase family protein [Nostoc sp. KVJ3]|uniref:M23 family metallopeptidase n=1 Tax=Nostoc sp. KVJ3 TaxID=457945 RepID=UPI002237259D|nr:M23 family metallopeptidase [Nostoc sp. KVJ3]MCW5316998.1 peptidoglycan DD-metalloendopeptidase family protein [Nostoc sp. KVJ3]